MSRGKATSLGAQHEREQEVAEGGGDAGDDDEEDHDDPVEGHDAVVPLVPLLHPLAEVEDLPGDGAVREAHRRLEELDADQEGGDAAEKNMNRMAKRYITPIFL